MIGVYVLNGDPIPLARPRFNSKNTIKAYDSQKNEKLFIGITLASQHNDRPLYSGALQLSVTFYFKIPKKTKVSSSYHIYRPDLSNLIKMIEDAATDILFKDDAIIASIIAKKVYDTNPRTEFTIKEL